MIRILQIGMSSNPGGVENFIMNVYRNIDRTKIQFDFFVDHNLEKIAYENEIEELGGNIYREYYRRKELLKKGRKSVKTFFKEHPEIRGVHLHTNDINPMFKVLDVAAKINLPVRIVHSHNSDYMRKLSIIDKMYELCERTKLEKIATNLLACSTKAGKWMFKDKNFEVIKNGIDINKYKFNKNKRAYMRENLNLQNKFVVGHIGRMHYQKNPLFLIDIFNAIHKIEPNSILLYIGDGVMKKEVNKRIKEYKLEKNVMHIGTVSDTQNYFQAMDCFVLPSKFEGLAIVAVEAQTNGLNTYISSNVISTELPNTSLLHPIDLSESPEKWAKKIIECKNQERQDKLLEIINDGYNIKMVVKKLEQLYCNEKN